jgi:hypothetical protein
MKSNLMWMTLLSYFIGSSLLFIAMSQDSYWAAGAAFFFIAKGGHWEERRNHV